MESLSLFSYHRSYYLYCNFFSLPLCSSLASVTSMWDKKLKKKEKERITTCFTRFRGLIRFSGIGVIPYRIWNCVNFLITSYRIQKQSKVSFDFRGVRLLFVLRKAVKMSSVLLQMLVVLYKLFYFLGLVLCETMFCMNLRLLLSLGI